MDYLKEFISKLHSLDRAKRAGEVFKDFLILSMCSLAQPFYRSKNLELKYTNTVKNYTKEQAEEFSKLLAFLVAALEDNYQDFLGQIYTALNLGDTKKGQFFTPYNVSRMMAEINFTDLKPEIENKGFITLSEPCSGSGRMIIAYAETMKANGYNYQHQLYVEAIDIDEMCFMMTYIQLALYGIPARVIRGDSLTIRYFEVLYTPFYFLSNMDFKLKKQQKSIVEDHKQNEEKTMQLTLFNYI